MRWFGLKDVLFDYTVSILNWTELDKIKNITRYYQLTAQENQYRLDKPFLFFWEKESLTIQRNAQASSNPPGTQICHISRLAPCTVLEYHRNRRDAA